jgi:hypothetical protein
LIALAALVAADGSRAASWVDEVDARPGGLLVIDLEVGGSIDISTWGQGRVAVEAEYHGPDAAGIRFEVAGGGDRVVVRAERGESRAARGAGGAVRLRVPARFDVELSTAGGEVRIDGLEGDVAGETMGGQLFLEGLCGELDLTTHGGNIRLAHSEVGGSVQTFGGNVHLEDVAGTVEARTLGGNVVYDNVRPGPGRCVAGSAESVKVSTHGGNIEVPLAPYGADLQTMGGNIEVEQAAGFVRAKTMGGNIVVGSVDGPIKATTMGGSVEVTVTGAGGDVRLTSLGGDVTLEVPRDFSMDVDITLAYTKNSRREYSIHSDFPLTIRRSDAWDYGSGSPRKYIYGTAASGPHRVKIETVNGDVRLIAGP